MTILPDSPPPRVLRSCLRRRYRSCELEICSASLRIVTLSTPCDANENRNYSGSPVQRECLRSLSYNDGTGFSGYGAGKALDAKNLQLCLSHSETASTQADEEDDSDDDNMRWANAEEHLQMALGSFGYGDNKRCCAAQIASGKENKAGFPGKLAPFPCSFARQLHSGPIKPHSGPFSGPVIVSTRPNSVVKACVGPSILPVNLLRKKMLGLDVCEPVSPEITCLGRVKIKEGTCNKDVCGAILTKERTCNTDLCATTDDEPSPCADKLEKRRCFDTNNQLCGKKGRGRKKKKIAEKSRCLSRRRRFASKETEDSKSLSSASSLLEETRREKAASLARVLTGLLEDVRRLEKDKQQYVPSVPPPNSLLLMRGGRRRDDACSPMMRGTLVVATVKDHDVDEALRVGGLVGDNCPCIADVRNWRNNPPPHLSLLDLIDREDEDSETDDTMATKGACAIPQGSDLSEKEESEAAEFDDRKNESGGGLSVTHPCKASLWQRRAITELSAIEVEQRREQEIKQQYMR